MEGVFLCPTITTQNESGCENLQIGDVGRNVTQSVTSLHGTDMHSYMRGTAIAADTDDKLVHLLPHTDVSVVFTGAPRASVKPIKTTQPFPCSTKAGMLFIVRALSKTRQPRLQGGRIRREEGRRGEEKDKGVERRRSTPVWRGMAKHGPDTAHSHLSKPWHGASGNGGWVNKKLHLPNQRSWVIAVFQCCNKEAG